MWRMQLFIFISAHSGETGIFCYVSMGLLTCLRLSVRKSLPVTARWELVVLFYWLAVSVYFLVTFYWVFIFFVLTNLMGYVTYLIKMFYQTTALEFLLTSSNRFQVSQRSVDLLLHFRTFTAITGLICIYP